MVFWVVGAVRPKIFFEAVFADCSPVRVLDLAKRGLWLPILTDGWSEGGRPAGPVLDLPGSQRRGTGHPQLDRILLEIGATRQPVTPFHIGKLIKNLGEYRANIVLDYEG